MAAGDPQTDGKPVIVLAAFGTSVPKAQAALEAIDSAVCAAYPEHEVRWALTAQFIIDKLRTRGQTTLFARRVPVKNLTEVYADLAREGKRNVVVQSLHVAPGGEYHQVRRTAVPVGLRVRYGKPLLADNGKVAQLARVLADRFGGADAVTLLCGHGNDHHAGHNKRLVALDRYVRAHYPNVFVATVEGQPGAEKALADARATGLQKVKFVPVMIVAGDHIMNDVMGDEAESWKARLGLAAEAEGGLGHNPAVVKLFLNRLASAMNDHAHATVAVQGKPVIVLAAFGTSVPKAQKALEHIDTRVRAAFPGREVRWALTAQFIINKLRKQGQTTLFARQVPIKNLEEIYADLRAAGKTEVVVQSLHVVPGGEWHELKRVDDSGLEVRFGKPLLNDTAMISRLTTVLAKRFGGDDTVTVLCGHGNDHHPGFNSNLVDLDAHVRAHYQNVFLATVEGQPGTEKAFADVKATGLKKVKFVPVMVVAGDHIMNDVMGPEAESWKSILGLEATAEGGLGENDEVVDLYIHRLRHALAER